MSEVEISVGGRRYTIACNPGEEKDVLLASEKLDKEAENMIRMKKTIVFNNVIIPKVYEYNENMIKMEYVEGIKLSVSVYAAIPFLLCVIAVLFLYSIDKSKETQIEKELMVRRAVKVEL